MRKIPLSNQLRGRIYLNSDLKPVRLPKISKFVGNGLLIELTENCDSEASASNLVKDVQLFLRRQRIKELKAKNKDQLV